MELKPRENEYHHQVVDCPFCPAWVYVRQTSLSSPDPLRDLKRHITNEAKKEAFEWALAGESNGSNPHLEYVREHTSVQQVRVVAGKRQYDSDMKLTA